MEGHCRDIWEREYSHLASKEDYTESTDAFEAWRNRMRNLGQQQGDEFSRYCPKGAGIATLGSKAMNPITWWDVLGQQFPSIRQWAFDTLACPATSCECERAFSSAKRLITSDRNSLGDELIEALECLKAWWDNGLVQRH
jgi:hAT family C-terminal dimerisation region